ncbi:GIY-YIG nuclease family protein [Thalassotalea sp. PS06]|uniref:GIY-YIG nuclease family protein n=1 Tax=Thalassotalea sp. PS06 TaxID=2594005 RepID=UPI001162B5AC|nr:GIY-YIG nuclease family protein [Thalassotalea sp. PS06]QDP02734.1 GIY-YIG nuclease family protein [Thalassotalea sp. PS06]
MKQPVIYIITNQHHTVFYVGVTSNLLSRISQHKNRQIHGFSKNYNLTKLVYVEWFDDMLTAIAREKQLKKWRRKWKIELIQKFNPEWLDLYFSYFQNR